MFSGRVCLSVIPVVFQSGSLKQSDLVNKLAEKNIQLSPLAVSQYCYGVVFQSSAIRMVGSCGVEPMVVEIVTILEVAMILP